MASTPEPMVRLQPGGVAPIISYNVPEPTTFSGRNFIDLQFPASHFVVPAHPAALAAPSTEDVQRSRRSRPPARPRTPDPAATRSPPASARPWPRPRV